MAKVTLDGQEYDMLRESKNKAEKEVEELKETIKGLETKSRVILTTEYVYPKVNLGKLNSEIVDLVKKAKDYDEYDYNYDVRFSFNTRRSFNLNQEVSYIISNNIKFDNHFYNSDKGNYSSSQYIGFEDIKAKVEEYYKKDVDKAIAGYKESEEKYNKLKDSVEEKIEEKYSNIINRLKNDKKVLIEKYEEMIKTKDEQIKSLQNEIADLNISNEDKIAKLKATIEEAEAKMRELTGVKKGFFSKIFK